MAFTYVSQTTYQNPFFSTDIVGTKPSWTTSWDIMFATIIYQSVTWSITTVPSWRTIIWTRSSPATYYYYTVYYKLAWASEPADYTWILSAAWSRWINISTYRWWFDNTSIIQSYSNTVYNTDNNIVRWAWISSLAANSPCIWLWWCYFSAWVEVTAPSSWWFSAVFSTNTSDWHWWWAIQTFAAWGNLSSADWAISLTTTDNKHAFVIALNPEVTTAIKTINWLAKASVKTINWLAIASVKTINWLA